MEMLNSNFSPSKKKPTISGNKENSKKFIDIIEDESTYLDPNYPKEIHKIVILQLQYDSQDLCDTLIETPNILIGSTSLYTNKYFQLLSVEQPEKVTKPKSAKVKKVAPPSQYAKKGKNRHSKPITPPSYFIDNRNIKSGTAYPNNRQAKESYSKLLPLNPPAQRNYSLNLEQANEYFPSSHNQRLKNIHTEVAYPGNLQASIG